MQRLAVVSADYEEVFSLVLVPSQRPRARNRYTVSESEATSQLLKYNAFLHRVEYTGLQPVEVHSACNIARIP